MGCECSNPNLEEEHEVKGDIKKIKKLRMNETNHHPDNPNRVEIESSEILPTPKSKGKSQKKSSKNSEESYQLEIKEGKSDYFILTPQKYNENYVKLKGKGDNNRNNRVSFHSVKGINKEKTSKFVNAKQLNLEGSTFEISPTQLDLEIIHHRFDQKFKYQGKKNKL